MKHGPSEIFKVLSVETRVKIVELLKTRGPLGAKTIAEHLGVTPAAASQHLKILKHAGMVDFERQGYHIPYSINTRAMDNCHRMLSEVCDCGPEQGVHGENDLESLKQYKEKLQKKLTMVNKKISDMEKDEE
jgi:ArsR family transcriptional regulator